MLKVLMPDNAIGYVLNEQVAQDNRAQIVGERVIYQLNGQLGLCDTTDDMPEGASVYDETQAIESNVPVVNVTITYIDHFIQEGESVDFAILFENEDIAGEFAVPITDQAGVVVKNKLVRIEKGKGRCSIAFDRPVNHYITAEAINMALAKRNIDFRVAMTDIEIMVFER